MSALIGVGGNRDIQRSDSYLAEGVTVTKLTAGDLQIISRIAVFRGLKAETVEHIVAPATALMLRPRD